MTALHGFADNDAVVVGYVTEIDVLIGQDGDRPIADTHDDLLQIPRGKRRPLLDFTVVRRLTPRIRPARIHVDGQPIAIGLEDADHLAARREPVLTKHARNPVTAVELAAHGWSIIVDSAPAAGVAVLAPPIIGLVQLLDRWDLAAEGASATFAATQDRLVFHDPFLRASIERAQPLRRPPAGCCNAASLLYAPLTLF